MDFAPRFGETKAPMQRNKETMKRLAFLTLFSLLGCALLAWGIFKLVYWPQMAESRLASQSLRYTAAQDIKKSHYSPPPIVSTEPLPTPEREPGCNEDFGAITISNNPDTIELWIEDPMGNAAGMREGKLVGDIPLSHSAHYGQDDDETGEDTGIVSQQTSIRIQVKRTYTIHVTGLKNPDPRSDEPVDVPSITIYGCNGDRQFTQEIDLYLKKGQEQQFILNYDPISNSKLEVPNVSNIESAQPRNPADAAKDRPHR